MKVIKIEDFNLTVGSILQLKNRYTGEILTAEGNVSTICPILSDHKELHELFSSSSLFLKQNTLVVIYNVGSMTK